MLVAIVMLRDEADILPTWLRHITALCDQVFAVDHLSDDGSSEILHRFAEAGLPIRSWRMQDPGYWQSAVTTELARYAFQSGAEWVLPFDVDEFLAVESKAHLRAILQNHPDPLGLWRWHHVVPSAERIESGDIDWAKPQFLANSVYAPNDAGKVVLHKSVFQKLPGFRLGSGNHLLHGAAFAKALHGDAMGTLWHCPVRSRDQITRKLRRDLASHMNAQTAALPELGAVLKLKTLLLQQISEGSSGTEMMQRMGLGYGELGVRCLDDPEILAKAITISPKLPMRDFDPIPTDSTKVRNPATERGTIHRTVYTLARARLRDSFMEIIPAGRSARFLHRLELGLGKWFTPGFRLARFLATRFVRLRLNMPARNKT